MNLDLYDRSSLLLGDVSSYQMFPINLMAIPVSHWFLSHVAICTGIRESHWQIVVKAMPKQSHGKY